MSTFRSPKYRELIVKFPDRTKVRFNRGTVEVEGETAQRLAEFAKANPEYGIEQADGTEEPRETEKQRLQREARERGLSDAGKVADLKARIDAHDAAQADGSDDDADGEPEDDDTDEDAGEGDSSEDDEN